MLNLTRLESREAPVSFVLDYTNGSDGFFTPTVRSVIEQATGALGARLSKPLSALDQRYTEYDLFGSEVGEPLPADTLRIHLGLTTDMTTPYDRHALALGAVGGYSADGGFLPRSWGGSIAFNPSVAWQLPGSPNGGFDLATVLSHELLHTLGANHVGDPASLMFQYTTPGVVKSLNRTDAAELGRLGWAVEMPPQKVPVDGWNPFPTFGGEVRVASGDFNGDGVADLAVAAGAGGGPHVKIRDGATGQEVASFYAYDDRFTGGVNIAAGDVNGDGRADLVTGAGPGGGPHVKVFSAGQESAVIINTFAFPENVTSGVSVCVSDGTVVAASRLGVVTVR